MVEILLDIILKLVASSTAEWFTLIILIATLYFVRKYTITAEKQTEVLIRQRDLSILPSIAFELRIDKTRPKNNMILLTNAGNSAAVNVEVEPIKDPFGENKNGVFKFHKIPSIGDIPALLTFDYAYKHEGLNKTLNGPDEQAKLNYLIHSSFNTFDIQIFFQDIEGNKYKQINKHIDGVYHHGIVERISNL